MSCVNKFFSTSIFVVIFLINAPVAWSQKPATQSLTCDEMQLTKILQFADQIHRETWRVMTNQNLSLGKSIWGRLARVYLVTKGKVKTKNILYVCDRYLVKKKEKETQILLNCGSQKQMKTLAKMNCHENHWKVQFNTSELSEVLGLATSILSPKLNCEIKIQNDKLDSYSCTHYYQDISGQKMILLDQYSFDKNRPIQIEVEGYYLENLRKTKKLTMKVPIEGQIDVTETFLNKPIETGTISHQQKNEIKKNQRNQNDDNQNQEKRTANQEEQAVEPRHEQKQKQIEQELEQGQSTEEGVPLDEDGVPQASSEAQQKNQAENHSEEDPEQRDAKSSEEQSEKVIENNQENQ